MTRYNDYIEIYGGDTEDGAKYGLLGLMTGISEEFWAAGWISSLEYSLWEARNSEGPVPFGMGEITPRQCRLLRDLSDEARCWWTYGPDGPTAMRLDEWKQHLDSLEVARASS